MTLTQFFAALKNAGNVLVTVTETDQGVVKPLAKIYGDGYAQLLATTLARTVDEIGIENAQKVTVHLAASL